MGEQENDETGKQETVKGGVFWPHFCEKLASFIVYFLALLVLLGICKYGNVLSPMLERIREGSSVEVVGFLKLGESELTPRVRVESAFESAFKFDTWLANLVSPSRPPQPFQLEVEERPEEVSLPVWIKVNAVFKEYNQIVEKCIYGSPMDQRPENKDIYSRIKKFFNYKFKDYVRDFEADRSTENAEKYFVMSYIAALYAIVEREQYEGRAEGIELFKRAEAYYSEMFTKYEAEAKPEDYCNQVFYFCWVKKDKDGKLLRSYYDKGKKESIIKAKKILGKNKKTHNTKEALEELWDQAYIAYCEAYLEMSYGKLLEGIKVLQSSQESITTTLREPRERDTTKTTHEDKKELFRIIMEWLFNNQRFLSVLYYNCNLMPIDYRVDKAEDILGEVFGQWDRLTEDQRYEVLFLFGQYYESVGKYKDAMRSFCKALKCCKKNGSVGSLMEDETREKTEILDKAKSRKPKEAEALYCLCRVKLVQATEAFYSEDYNKSRRLLSDTSDLSDKLKEALKEVPELQQQHYEDSKNDLSSIVDIAIGCDELRKYETHPDLYKNGLEEAQCRFRKVIRDIRNNVAESTTNDCPSKGHHVEAESKDSQADLRVKAMRWLGNAYFLEAKYGHYRDAVDTAIEWLGKAKLQLKADIGYLKEKSEKLKEEAPSKEELRELRKKYLIKFPGDIEVYHLLSDAHMLRYKYRRNKQDEEDARKYLEEYEEHLKTQRDCSAILEDPEFATLLRRGPF